MSTQPQLSVRASTVMNRILGHRGHIRPRDVRDAFIAGKIRAGAGGALGLGKVTLAELERYAYPETQGAVKCYGMGIGHAILQAIECPNRHVTSFSLHFDINRPVLVRLEYIADGKIAGAVRRLAEYRLHKVSDREKAGT